MSILGSSRFKSILYYYNSVVVFLFGLTIVYGSPSTFSALILLPSLIFVPYLFMNENKSIRQIINLEAWYFIAIIVFFVYFVLHSISFKNDISDNERVLKFLLSILVMIYLSYYKFSTGSLWNGVVLGAVVASIMGSYEYYYLGYSRASVNHNPIVYGNLMLVLSVLILWKATLLKNKLKILYVFSGLLSLHSVFISGTRGAILSFFILVLSLAVFFIIRSREKLKVITFLIVLLLAGVIMITQTNLFGKTYGEFQNIQGGNINTSIGLRFQMWHVGLESIKDSPMFGKSLNYRSDSDLRDFITTKGYNISVIEKFSHFHNQYIDYMVKNGFFGLLFFLGVFITAFFNKQKMLIPACALVVSCLALGNLTESLFSSGRIFTVFVMLVPLLKIDFYRNKGLC